MLISINWTLFPQVKIILIPDQEFLSSVVDYIKQSLELRKWGSHWSMHNFYEYMTFLYVVHVYMFSNVVLYCIALPARVLFAIKIIFLSPLAFKYFNFGVYMMKLKVIPEKHRMHKIWYLRFYYYSRFTCMFTNLLVNNFI